MSVYKLHKKGRSGRRVAVRAERIEWNIPAIVICILLAFAIWLYIVNFSSRASEKKSEPSVASAQAEVIDVTEVALV